MFNQEKPVTMAPDSPPGTEGLNFEARENAGDPSMFGDRYISFSNLPAQEVDGDLELLKTSP